MPENQSLPFVTIVIPARNESCHIRQSLGAVLSQDYPSEKLQIIVADGLSTDGTREIVQKYQAQHPNLLLLDNPGKIVSTGLNAAIRQAQGEYIIRVDGHTIVAPDYARQCVFALLNTQAENAGGKMTAVGHGLLGESIALATSSPFGVGGGRFHYSDRQEWVDTVYMGAWRREIFTRIGLFDEELVRDQDDEFNYRLREHGGKILLVPAIKSNYTVRNSLHLLWKQYYQYGVWKVRVLQKHSRQMRLGQFIPPAFTAALLGSGLLTLFNDRGSYLFALIVVTYLLADLVASAWAASRKGWKYLPILILIYPVLHVSYGLGFLVGLARFANRWRDKLGEVPRLNPTTH